MHRAKILMPALVLTLILGLSSTAFADISCDVESVPTPRATSTGHTETTGDLTFDCTGTAGATTAATVTIEYGLTITNSTSYPAGGFIWISDTSGDFTASNVSIASVDNATGQIILILPSVASPAASSTFTLSRVLISLADASGSSVDATLTLGLNPDDSYSIASGGTTTVITTVMDGLGNPTVSESAGGTGSVRADGIISDGSIGVSLAEAYIDALQEASQIELTFAGVTSGVSLTGCGATVTSGTVALTPTTITSSDSTATISFTTGLDLTSIDTITVSCTGITVGSDGAPSEGDITVQASLAPTGSALDSDGSALADATTGQIPRYSENLLPATPLVVVTFAPASTNLLVPFALRVGGFDTGISVANTTDDPFVKGGAASAAGPITFYFYNENGDSATFTTSSVASGSTYSENLSVMLPLATPPITGDFEGYVFVQADFTHAHGAAFIVDWSGATNFTSAVDVLVLPPPGVSSNSRDVGDDLIESLGQ
jgi:hypothetical protein